MLMHLEDVRLQVRADSRDELVVAEGFMEAQVDTPSNSSDTPQMPL